MILVTGHAGFLGQHIGHRLSVAGLEWCGLDVRPTVGQRHVVADVRDINRLRFDSETITEVIHLASPVGVRTTSWNGAATQAEIVDAAYAVASFAKAHNAKVLFVSSSEIYGDAGNVIGKDTGRDPRSGYARGKVEAESVFLNTVAGAVVIRPFNVYGYGQRSEFVVPMIIESVMSGKPVPLVNEGRAIRQLTYVGDLVEAVQRIRVAWSKLAGQALNIAGPETIAIRDLAQVVGRLLDRPVTFSNVTPEQVGRNPRSEIKSRMVDPTAIDEWRPCVGIEHGLTLMLAGQSA